MEDKTTRLNALFNYWDRCTRCSLSNERKNVIFGYGEPNAKILIIGEAPGENEDESGYPFVGKAGMLLDQLLALVSINPDVKEVSNNKDDFDPKLLRDLLTREYFYANVVACHPPENRDPSPKEIEACLPRILKLIYIIDPILIMSVGKIALTALTGKRSLAITQVHGELFDIAVPGLAVGLNYPLLAILHTSYLLRMNDFQSKTGLGAKTYKDILRAHEIVDQFNNWHFGVPIPSRGGTDK